ncbi:hypothetical protein [Micromonospora haikouensis]|nr:hypothetical protein [Micromonospora haikouensis]
MPKSRGLAKGEELTVINRHLKPLLRGIKPKPGKVYRPSKLNRTPLEQMSEGDFHLLLIWFMPYYHTTYTSDLNEYKRFLDSVLAESYRLDVALLLGDMYPICRTITKERQAVRLRALKKKAA